jgi:hypothetical protein
MKSDISDKIERYEKKLDPDVDNEQFFTAALNELEKKFPFYDLSVWMDANFTKNYNWDNLAECQKNIIIEMDKVFMTIYEGMIDG